MKRFSWLISKYLIQAILPYFIFSWLLVSVILFVQQASRYAEIFFNSNIPQNLVWQLSLALIPNVIVFTGPMAILIGTIIGLSKLQSDSELISIRASGVGNFQITLPIIFLGIALSLFTFCINLYGVPFAAQLVRKIALETTLYKLESPIEPGVFNAEINGFTIYVRDGNFQTGEWKNVFIHTEDKKDSLTRLITSTNGRIDSTNEVSELVLNNAILITLSLEKNKEKITSEVVKEFRLLISTKRGEVIEKLSKTQESPEELGLGELIKFAATKHGKEKTEVNIIWQRRIILSLTPLIFAILGTALVLRFKRGGKGFGIFWALICIVAYYLLTIFGEQLARTNKVSVLFGSILPVLASVLLIFWFFIPSKFLSFNSFIKILRIKNIFRKGLSQELSKKLKSNLYINFTTNILDFDIIKNLFKYFILTFVFLTTIYVIFTAFELWKFASEIDGGAFLLLTYLFFLIPFIYIQLAPSALMIGILATFVIKSRQNEIVTWTAAGQSVYRLLLPCFLLMIFLGVINWEIQEKISPKTNKIQDELRLQIRSRRILANREGKFWVADDKQIYSFELIDNKNYLNPNVKNLSIYEFSDDYSRLNSFYKADRATWEKDKIKFIKKAEKIEWINDKVKVSTVGDVKILKKTNPFNAFYQKPSHLTTNEIEQQLNYIESETEKQIYQVAIEKKYATLFLPVVITLFTAPFALSLNKKGKALTVGYAFGLWLLFMGITNTFDQFGLNGYISPKIAIWSPLFLFSILGVFLISKVKT
jgi:lipopolysaccharide export LptBFGC system permease protein LptF